MAPKLNPAIGAAAATAAGAPKAGEAAAVVGFGAPNENPPVPAGGPPAPPAGDPKLKDMLPVCADHRDLAHKFRGATNKSQHS